MQDRMKMQGRISFARLRRRQRRGEPTFVFVDLVGFTSATERMGDVAAADLARRFRGAMCALSCRLGSRQVKSMGDGVMIWAHDPAAAVRLASRTVDEIGRRADLLPVRVGVHTGPAVRRGRDWYGRAVNIAARLAAQAEPNQALVSAATRSAVGDPGARGLDGCRRLELRGVSEPLDVWRLA
jgi:adenylate cyclase